MPPPPPPHPQPQQHPPTLPAPRSFLSSLLNNLPPPNPKPNAATASTASTTSTNPLPPTSKPPLLTLHALFPTLLLPALDLLDRCLLTRFLLNEPSRADEEEEEEEEGGEEATTTTTTANPNRDPNAPPPLPLPSGPKKPSISRRRIIYYALSSTSSSHNRPSSRHSRRHHDPLTSSTHYEIRPYAWSCTCPAFAFAAYNTTFSPPEPVIYGEAEAWDDGGDDLVSTNNHEDDEMLDVPEPEAMHTGGDDECGHEHEWWGGLMRGEEDVPLCKHLLASLLAERWEVVGEMVEEKVIGREEMGGWAAGWGG